MIFFNAQLSSQLRGCKFSQINLTSTLPDLSKYKLYLDHLEGHYLYPNALKLDTTPNLLRKTLSHGNRFVMGFITSSFTLILNYTNQGSFVGTTEGLNSKASVANPANKLYPNPSVRYLWHAWANYILTLYHLALRNSFIFIITSARLAELSQALSWQTFNSSYLYWKVLLKFILYPKITKATLGISKHHPNLTSNLTLLLLRPITSYVAYVFFRKLRLPVVGFGATLTTDRLLWQNAGFFSIDLNLQYALIVIYWSLLKSLNV